MQEGKGEGREGRGGLGRGSRDPQDVEGMVLAQLALGNEGGDRHQVRDSHGYRHPNALQDSTHTNPALIDIPVQIYSV